MSRDTQTNQTRFLYFLELNDNSQFPKTNKRLRQFWVHVSYQKRILITTNGAGISIYRKFRRLAGFRNRNGWNSNLGGLFTELLIDFNVGERDSWYLVVLAGVLNNK